MTKQMSTRFCLIALAFAIMMEGASAGRWSWYSRHSYRSKEPKTVVKALLKDRDTFVLAAAAAKAGLIDDLSAEGPFTVFAPNNKAFVEAANELDTSIFGLLFNPDLADILKYHVVLGDLQAANLTDGQQLVNLAGNNLTVSIDENGTVMIDGATVVEADKKAGNGVVHIIDSVILPSHLNLPETVVDIAKENLDTVSTLVAALSTDSTAAIKAALDDPNLGPFTVFAPTDDAFEAAGVTSLDIPELPEILQYHVVLGKILSSDLEDGEKLVTLLGDNLTVSINEAGVFINNAQVIQPDLEAKNGVVHVVNAVLAPSS